MNFVTKLFRKTKLRDVFTPTTYAQLSYINRPNLESIIESNLQLKGKQIVLFGPSGSGKSTIIRHILNIEKANYIYSMCESNTTLEGLILSAFDKLNKYYLSSKDYKISTSIGFEFEHIASKLGANSSSETSESFSRIIPPQLTPQKLAEFLGEINGIWIIEDFHKVAEAEKKRIADVLKIFIDVANEYKEVRIICIGAVGSARELIELDSNLSHRVAQIHIPLLTDKEIGEIITSGEELMHIEMAPQLKEKIIHYSNNIASIAHQMCFDVCNVNGIHKAQWKKKILDDSNFKSAVESYIVSNADTFKGVYDSIVKQPMAWYVLKSLTVAPEKGLGFEELMSRVNKKKSKRDFDTVSVRNLLEYLISPEVNLVRYDGNSDKYTISTPFWKAFLKMQQALEAAESQKAKKKEKVISLMLSSQNDLDSIVYDSMLTLLDKLKHH